MSKKHPEPPKAKPGHQRRRVQEGGYSIPLALQKGCSVADIMQGKVNELLNEVRQGGCSKARIETEAKMVIEICGKAATGLAKWQKKTRAAHSDLVLLKNVAATAQNILKTLEETTLEQNSDPIALTNNLLSAITDARFAFVKDDPSDDASSSFSLSDDGSSDSNDDEHLHHHHQDQYLHQKIMHLTERCRVQQNQIQKFEEENPDETEIAHTERLYNEVAVLKTQVMVLNEKCKGQDEQIKKLSVDEGNRLKGELCIMSAKYHALAQQLSATVLEKQRLEAELKASGAPPPSPPPPPTLLDNKQQTTALEAKVKDLTAEHEATVEQLAKYKHRSILLSRYETKVVRLETELETVCNEKKTAMGDLQTVAEDREQLHNNNTDLSAKLAALTETRSALETDLSAARKEISELRKTVTNLKGIEPDPRVLKGLKAIEELRVMHNETMEELLSVRHSEANIVSTQEELKDAKASLSAALSRGDALQQHSEKAKSMAKEVARIPALKQKIASLSFTAEKAEWDRKVLSKDFTEKVADLTDTIASLKKHISWLESEQAVLCST